MDLLHLAGLELAPAVPAAASVVAITGWLRSRAAHARVQRAEQSAASQLDALFAALPGGLALVDRELRYVRLNDELARMQGVSVATSLGRTVREVVPALADHLEPLYRRVLDTGEPLLDVELRGESPAEPGVPKQWRINHVPVGGVPGRPDWVGVSVQDVTARVRLAEVLALETERRQFLLDLGEAVARAPGPDAALRVACEWLGARLRLSHGALLLHLPGDARVRAPAGLHQVRGSPLPDEPFAFPAATGPLAGHGPLVVPDTRLHPATRDDDARSYTHLGIRAFVAVPLHRGGEAAATFVAADDVPRHWSAAEVRLLREAAERIWPIYEIAALAAEMERRVEARTLELAASNRALDEANKELEAFSWSVSHDLRAPLRAMDGFSQALLEDYGDRLDEEGRSHLGFIREGAQHMGQLVNGLLDLSRVSRRAMTSAPVDLSALAAGVLERLRHAEPGRTVEVHVEPGIVAPCDAQLVGIALGNLLGNAWKFTAHTDGARVAFWSETLQGETVYVVHDNGAGFDMRYAGKLFVPFQRLHGTEEFEGTGIGLATVHRVVRRHGGRIWAEGCVGRGATFRFTLGPPAAPA